MSLLSSKKSWRLIPASSIPQWKCSKSLKSQCPGGSKTSRCAQKSNQGILIFTSCSAAGLGHCGQTGISKISPAFYFLLLSRQETFHPLDFSASLSWIPLAWEAQNHLLGAGMGWSKQQGTTPSPVPGPSSVPAPLPWKSCCLTNPSPGTSEG